MPYQNDRETPNVDQLQDALDSVSNRVENLRNHFGSPHQFGIQYDEVLKVIAGCRHELKTALEMLTELETEAEALETELEAEFDAQVAEDVESIDIATLLGNSRAAQAIAKALE